MVRTRAKAADPTAMALPYLSTTFDIPEPEIQTLLDAPTAELMQQFLASLTAKSHEYDALQADKVKVEVELDNTVRTSDSKIKAQKAQVTKHVKDVEDLRKKLSEAETARESLASELEQLRSSTSGSTAETSALRQRIETLEASNRDALALVESKSTEKDRVATELSEQHSKLLGLRRELSELEERNQSLENAASSQKFKEQSLQQEIDLLKRNNEWHSNELQTRTQEHAKFRKERNARIASLQRELEDSNANVETLKRTETTLRQRLDEVQAKADEAFARIASLQEETARKERDFRTELDATKRLADLQAQSAATHKARLQDVQGQVDRVKEDAADEIGRLQAEIETERSDKEQAERKVAELELTVERLEQMPRPSRPGTPMRNGGLDPTTPSRLGSRAGSPSAMSGSLRKTVNGLSFTQVYSNWTEAQQELEQERRRTKKLQDALDDVVTQMEEREPVMLEMREDQERLEQEVLNFSNLLDEANTIRESAVKEAQRWQGEATAAAHEGDILRQQLRDLSAQIKILLVEIRSRDEGLDDMSAQERLELERAARGELASGELDRMTDTGRFIAERLVIFRDVSDLQEKNQQMLRLVETLGDQLEGEEAQAKERQTAAYASENEELRQKVQRLQDELQATVTQIDSYMKERDMFRRMLQHRGQLPAGEADLQSMFGQSVPPATPSRNNGAMEPPTPRSKDVEDLNKLLREQQTFFDQYRNETATDRRMLKEQVDALAREKGNLQADVARLQSQLELASGRYEMLQGNMNGVRGENQELQKRSQQLAEQAARQDLRTQQVAEDLVEARSMTESLRNENANAKAEKELWKRIEARLTDDNKSLMDERSRLNKLVTDLQTLQNERELADSESRRRLQSRTETLETELSETKKKLEHEVDESRKASLRREYEEGQSRTRIDDLVKSLGNVREELVAATTTRDQLQARVEEMRIELRSAEEKVVALQPRPTPRAQTQNEPPQTNGDADGELPAEQRLALEVADLKRDLELSRNELEAAKQSAEQYRSISQSTEEELASINETSEQYREDMDRQLAEKDARIKELEQRVEDLTSELTSTNAETSELRTKADDATRALTDQKNTFDADLARLRDDADRYTEEKKLYQEDLKAQAEIAQQAQQSYEDELVKHAEAAKALQGVRKEYNELRTEVAGVRAEAEAAKAGLERGEESWGAQKERFERELEEVRRGREDVGRQNGLLHGQMEAFSKELKALREGRVLPAGAAAGDEGEEGAGSPSRGGDTGSLQEVIRYLRREKEIVDVQYELSIQEGKRVQQQLDYATAQLEDARQKLAEERRVVAEKSASEGSTNKLLETLNELNLYRESTTTLRNENRVQLQRLEERSEEVERLVAEIEPLKARVGELEGEVEGKEGEMELLRKDRDHYQERVNTILSKYDRVDPAEHESLKSQIEELKAEKERLEAEQAPLREQIEGSDTKYTEMEAKLTELLEKFRVQAKDQNRKQNTEKGELRAERDKINGELEGARAELARTKAALSEAETKLAEKGGAEEGEVDEGGEDHAALHARISEAEARAAEHAARAEELSTQVSTLQARVQELEGQVAEVQLQLETARQQGAAENQQPTAHTDDETLEKLRQDRATAQQEVEVLRANAGSNGADAPAQPTIDQPAASGDKSAAQQVQEAVDRLRAEMEAQHQLALTQKDEEVKSRIAGMRDQLNRKLKEDREKFRQDGRGEAQVQHEAELQKLKEEHEAAVQQMKEAHQAELDRLAREGGAAVQKVEGSGSGTEVSNNAEAPAGIVKAEDGHFKVESDEALAHFDFSDSQVLWLIKNHERVKVIVRNSVRSNVAKETEKAKQAVEEKQQEVEKLQAEIEGLKTEISSLKESQGGEEVKSVDAAAAARTAELDAKIAELTKKVEAAQKDKELAVRAVELKGELQNSTRQTFMAQITKIKQFVKDTPEMGVKEAWDVAVKERGPTKKPAVLATGATAPAGSAQSQSPAAAAQKNGNAVPPSPSTAQGQTQAQAVQSPAAETDEQAKLRARQERFGSLQPASPSGQPPQATTSFGQPSIPSGPAAGTFGKPSTSTFGAPSQPAALAQPARRPSGQQGPAGTAPNPQAAAFTPGGGDAQRPNVGTGPAVLRGLSSAIPRAGGGPSNLPRPGTAAGRGGAVSPGISIQGAAAASQGRGGSQSGASRGVNNNAARGGRGGQTGGIPRAGGAQQNAGQKRPHDGDGGAGDGKRSRSGGPGGGV